MEEYRMEMLLKVAPSDLEFAVNLQSYLKRFGVSSDISIGTTDVDCTCLVIIYNQNWTDAYPETPDIPKKDGQYVLIMTDPDCTIPAQWTDMPDVFNIDYYDEVQLSVYLLLMARLIRDPENVIVDDITAPNERFYVGAAFAMGMILDQNVGKALDIWQSAADDGDKDSALQIAIRAYQGTDGTADKARALRYFLKVGMDYEAMDGWHYRVARMMLADDTDASASHDEAMRWMHRAAEKEDADALYYLSKCSTAPKTCSDSLYRAMKAGNRETYLKYTEDPKEMRDVPKAQKLIIDRYDIKISEFDSNDFSSNDLGSIPITETSGRRSVCGGIGIEYNVTHEGKVNVEVSLDNCCDCSTHVYRGTLDENGSLNVYGNRGVSYNIALVKRLSSNR